MKFSLDRLIQDYLAEREGSIEIDPVTLSRGLVLRRLGPATDRWGRPVELVDVRVLEKNAHHRKHDRVIWEIPPEEELSFYKGTREEKLKAWLLAMS